MSLLPAQQSPYAKWKNSPPTDPNYFPIGVWLQDPANASKYKALGINAYVGLWKGPTPEQHRASVQERLGDAGLEPAGRAR